MRTFPASFPHTIWFFSDYFLFFSQGFCQFWEQSVDENLPCILSPYYLIFFWLFFVFFSRFLPVLRTICRWKPSLHPFPILFDFFLIIFCFFSQGFCQFWEQSVDENLPCILSPYYLICFWLFFVFFSGFLPVLRTICGWKPSLHPFPILFDLFLVIFCFFLRVFASFENTLWMNTFPASFPHTIWFFSDYFLFFFSRFLPVWEQSVDENLPCILSPYYLIFFWLFFDFFSEFLPVLRTICRWKPPLLLSRYYLIFFWLFFVFFSGFLPVLRTICGWEPSLHPFPILFDFFLIIFWFFLTVFASFENNL